MGRDGDGTTCRCELCGAPAAVHCAADAAFLCAACDAKVHGANFLASRHLRTRLQAAAPAEDDDDGYESPAGSCVSTADSAPARRGRAPGVSRSRGEAVLEGWARRMGLAPGAARRRAAAAGRALRACGPARVPLRVAMAAALWREVAAAGDARDDALLRRLEACTHVPARLVVAAAASLARARARRREDDAVEEGWDECAWAGPKPKPKPKPRTSRP